jgi:MSHA biogenesis protein MshE
MQKKIRIGDLLVQQGFISEEQLQQALEEQKASGVKLGEAIVKLGFMDENTFLNFFAKNLGIPFVDLKQREYDNDLISLLPEAYARQFQAIVLEKQPNGILVGMVDPLDINAVDELSNALNAPLEFALVKPSDLQRTLDLVYRRTGDISTYATQLSVDIAETEKESKFGAIEEVENAPVNRLIESIFEDAVQVRASDIHIEPDATVLRIRLRIDGLLTEQIMKDKTIINALSLKLKLMAGLNISEKRMPQDGRFHKDVKGHSIDVRLSTLPTQFGESVVMRLLDQSGGLLSLDTVGMDERTLKMFREIIKQPRGLILVTGPTGSGKTTTLYGALSEINFPESKIITVEDPIEYYLPRIVQVQVAEKLDLDFARVLRTAMRQDPDIILVGEIRDEETAEIALRAGLTGHLVLSTLHANDAVSSAMRLVDLGAPGYLVADTLLAVLAQRLVRRICGGCKQQAELTEADKFWWETNAPEDFKTSTFYQGEGCAHCNMTGYQGRVGLFELMHANTDMRMALQEEDIASFNEAARKQMGKSSLLYNGSELVHKGISTVAEVKRVVGDDASFSV